MRNSKAIAVIAAEALIAFAVLMAPVNAQPGPPEIPAEVNIEDPLGDANYLNDQGVSDSAPRTGDHVTPADGGSLSDIMKVWFTDTPDTVSAHIQTEGFPGATSSSIFYRVRVAVDSAATCVWFEAFAQGVTNPNPPSARLRQTCSGSTTVPGELSHVQGPNATAIITITVPRSAYPGFETDGTVLKTPTAESRNNIGGAVTAPQVDNTQPGTDYVIGSSAGGGGGGPKPTATGTGTPAPTASPETSPSPSPKPTSPPDKDKKKKCPNKNKGSNSKKCKKKKGKGKGPTQPKPSPSPTSTPAPTSGPPTPSPTPTG